MSQLTSSDNCEPRALSKGTTVIVLIGPPTLPPPFLLCLERKTLSNVIAPQHLKIKHAHKEHQKGKMSAFYLQRRTIVWHFGALSGLASELEQAAVSVIAGSGPHWPARGVRLGSRCMTFKLANNDGRANQSVSGRPETTHLEDFAQPG